MVLNGEEKEKRGVHFSRLTASLFYLRSRK